MLLFLHEHTSPNGSGKEGMDYLNNNKESFDYKQWKSLVKVRDPIATHGFFVESKGGKALSSSSLSSTSTSSSAAAALAGKLLKHVII